MKSTCFAVFFVALIFPRTHACLNVYYTQNIEGEFIEKNEIFNRLFRANFDAEKEKNKLNELWNELQKEANCELLSDYAVGLMRLGHYQDALIILEYVNSKFPNQYNVVANLGTAYELNGQLENALHWIKKGIELNPQSHNGSEWIHVKILEAKIALQKDSNFLKDYTVLELSGEQLKDEAVFHQLWTQLYERFPFSPSEENPIMADLFITLGDLSAQTLSTEYAQTYYLLAQNYYFASKDLVKSKLTNLKNIRRELADKTLPEVEQGESVRASIKKYSEIIDFNAAKTTSDTYHFNAEEIIRTFDSSYTYQQQDEAPIQKDPLDKNSKKSLEDWLKENWMYLLVGFLVFDALVFGYILYRKHKNS